MIITCSQKHRTDKYSQHSSIIYPVWLNGWVFVYKLGGYGVKSRCCHWNLRYRACFKQRVFWFLLYAQDEGYRDILKLNCRLFAFCPYEGFLKNKKTFGTSLPLPHFLHDEKNFSLYILLTDQISLSLCFYFSRYWTTCVLQLFISELVTS